MLELTWRDIKCMFSLSSSAPSEAAFNSDSQTRFLVNFLLISDFLLLRLISRHFCCCCWNRVFFSGRTKRDKIEISFVAIIFHSHSLKEVASFHASKKKAMSWRNKSVVILLRHFLLNQPKKIVFVCCFYSLERPQPPVNHKSLRYDTSMLIMLVKKL